LIQYALSRNAHQGATLQHELPPGVWSRTLCGLDIAGWSREYTTIRYETILCRRCRGVRR
jgi:hypothetical protein